MGVSSPSFLAFGKASISSSIYSMVPVPTWRPDSSSVTYAGVPVSSKGNELSSPKPHLLPDSELLHPPVCSLSSSKAFIINPTN